MIIEPTERTADNLRYRVYRAGNPYSHAVIESDSLVDLAEQAINAFSHAGTEALIWDGDIAHYCSRKCLRGGLATLDRFNLWLIAVYGQGHGPANRQNRASDHASGYADLIIDQTSDANLWCDECHARIGEHFGDCLVCEDEIIISDDDWSNRHRAQSIGEYYDGSGNGFVGVCNDCANGQKDWETEEPTDLDLRDRVLCAVLVDRYTNDRFVEVMTNDDLWNAVKSQRAVTTSRVNGQLDADDFFGLVGPLFYLARGPLAGWETSDRTIARELLDAATTAELHATGTTGTTTAA